MKDPVRCLNYSPDQTLLDVLGQVRESDSNILLCGPQPATSLAGLVPWIYTDEVMSRWEDAGTYLGQEEDRAPTLALRRGEQTIKLRWSSTWLASPVTADEMTMLLAQVDDLLGQKIGSRSLNWSSPVALGRHLMQTCWHLQGLRTPPAPPEIRALLTEHSPQGRHECLTLPEVETIPALYQYDMRLAYLWCCKGLPYGAVEEINGDAGGGGHKAAVEWEAPEGWAGIGLLPERHAGWTYPLRGRGWVDRREYDLAARSGWEMRIADALTWESEGALDKWSDLLQWALRQDRDDERAHDLLRRVALNSIGSLHRSSVRRYRALPRAEKDRLPAGNPTLRLSEDGQYWYWYDEAPIQGRGLIYVHPEWTTTIWARCRARMAQAALSVPRQHLIAIRQDALFTACEMPWSDDGRVGRLRLKDKIDGPLPAPHSLAEFDAIRQESEA